MALIADFMLVWLPAPTVSLRPKLTAGAGGLAKFFYNCPDNAFQVTGCSSHVCHATTKFCTIFFTLDLPKDVEL